MEKLVNAPFWQGKRVLVTGDTGFKGSWLALWLNEMGARVTGFALAPPTEPSLFERAGVSALIDHVEGDVRDLDAVARCVEVARPDIVFHLAAQSLVRQSYADPVETYATNVMGTVHVLEACRRVEGIAAILCVTSDKCYENREWVWPYRETDPMGGHDPYSSSKGAAELVVSAYRSSFFNEGDGPLVASVRAGNVIGGGDWAADRLIPDIVRAVMAGEPPVIRSPQSVRPWQHVLEALGGYLRLAERLAIGERRFADGWNFGPDEGDARSVEWIVQRLLAHWGDTAGWVGGDAPALHEAKMLRLDCSKARAALGWRPRLTLDEALRWIVDWHRAEGSGEPAGALSVRQINDYAARPPLGLA